MDVRDRIASLRARLSKPRPLSNTPEPWWVRALTDIGRPAVAIIVMGMCAPGEHHLGVLAGWDTRLAWGMAAVLAAYAGIAAVVATRRPQPSAVLGAMLALIAAMAAQPVSHAFVTGWLTATPRTPLWLVIVVSCVPPLVLGHLLHLAASPGAAQPEQASETAEPESRQTPEAQPAPASEDTPAPKPETAEQPDGTSPLLSTREVALRMGVSPSTVGTWVSRGKLTPAGRDDRGNLFDPTHLAG